jgi:hypothetical protein
VLIDWAPIEQLLLRIYKKRHAHMVATADIRSTAIANLARIKRCSIEKKQLVRDLLLHRLVIELGGVVPDCSTLWRFRNHPSVKHLQNIILAEINIVDAATFETQPNRPSKEKAAKTFKEAAYTVKAAPVRLRYFFSKYPEEYISAIRAKAKNPPLAVETARINFK